MKTLIADDEKISQLAIKDILEREGLNIELCNNGKKALDLIRKSHDFRIVILDQGLPDIDGITICREIRRLNLARYVYVIIILVDQKQDIHDSMEAGADDYINRPIDNDIFTFRMKAGIRVLNMEDKLFHSQKELIKLVREDVLTTLLNRRSFLDEAIKQLERALREEYQVSAILIDIDNFKKINEIYGNQFGDRILTEIANRIKFTCRPYDTIGRFGGEEFCILLPNTKANNAAKIAKRLKSTVSKKLYEIRGEKINIKISIGISSISPDIGLKSGQIDELIRRTEIALSKAKKEGKDRIAINA